VVGTVLQPAPRQAVVNVTRDRRAASVGFRWNAWSRPRRTIRIRDVALAGGTLPLPPDFVTRLPVDLRAAPPAALGLFVTAGCACPLHRVSSLSPDL